MTLAPIASSGSRGSFRIGDHLVTPAANEIDGARIEAKAMDVLVALAEAAPGVLSSATLLELIWPDVVVVDNVVYQAVAQLRRVLGDDAHAPRYIQTVPRRGYRLIAEIRPETSGAHPTLAAAPSTPPADSPSVAGMAWPSFSTESMRSNGERVQDGRTITRRWVIVGIPIAMTVALAAFMFDAAILRPGAQSSDVRIGVDVFESPGNSKELERYADETTAALVRVLATSGIRTIDHGAGEGTEGRAEFVLRGRVEREGDNLEVSATLVSRHDGFVLWSTKTKAKAVQFGVLKEQFSAGVAWVVGCALRQKGTTNSDRLTDLFAKYLQICEAFHFDIERTPELARRLVESAPEQARPHAIEALANAFVSTLGTPSGTRRPDAEIARLRAIVYDSAKIATEIDARSNPWLARALVVDPTVGLAQRETFLQQSYANEGEVFALYQQGLLLECVGRIRDAHVYVERAVKEAPLDQGYWAESAILTAWLGKISVARQNLEDWSANTLDPVGVDTLRMWIELWFDGDLSRAKSISDRLDAQGQGWRYVGIWPCVKRWVDAAADRVRLSEEAITAGCPAGFIALAYFGHVDAAYGNAEVFFSLSEVERNLLHLSPRYLFFPYMRAVRADPRFMPLAHRIGLVDYWLETDRWPDFCATEKLPYDCKQAALAAHTAATK